MGWWNDTTQQAQIVVIPALCFDDLKAQVGDKLDGGMRGLYLRLEREGSRREGRLHPFVMDLQHTRTNVPPGVNVPYILARMWRVKLEDLLATSAIAECNQPKQG